jgi:hypothetical protein
MFSLTRACERVVVRGGAPIAIPHGGRQYHGGREYDANMKVKEFDKISRDFLKTNHEMHLYLHEGGKKNSRHYQRLEKRANALLQKLPCGNGIEEHSEYVDFQKTTDQKNHQMRRKVEYLERRQNTFEVIQNEARDHTKGQIWDHFRSLEKVVSNLVDRMPEEKSSQVEELKGRLEDLEMYVLENFEKIEEGAPERKQFSDRLEGLDKQMHKVMHQYLPELSDGVDILFEEMEHLVTKDALAERERVLKAEYEEKLAALDKKYEEKYLKLADEIEKLKPSQDPKVNQYRSAFIAAVKEFFSKKNLRNFEARKNLWLALMNLLFYGAIGIGWTAFVWDMIKVEKEINSGPANQSFEAIKKHEEAFPVEKHHQESPEFHDDYEKLTQKINEMQERLVRFNAANGTLNLEDYAKEGLAYAQKHADSYHGVETFKYQFFQFVPLTLSAKLVVAHVGFMKEALSLSEDLEGLACTQATLTHKILAKEVTQIFEVGKQFNLRGVEGLKPSDYKELVADLKKNDFQVAQTPSGVEYMPASQKINRLVALKNEITIKEQEDFLSKFKERE